ncbi:hypothetical protein FN846DRAFT_223632 [Sphaerosporella brunnea]|uniref:Uncharacterized protein n=1 Tax=Sphaerosporella brunnea TaxID=1250544 RepID=A0A5J5EMF6_9PEZI|nr:hypothetical protein FN846DRAFT_223632 [Sphaerosporella brunnea]
MKKCPHSRVNVAKVVVGLDSVLLIGLGLCQGEGEKQAHGRKKPLGPPRFRHQYTTRKNHPDFPQLTNYSKHSSVNIDKSDVIVICFGLAACGGYSATMHSCVSNQIYCPYAQLLCINHPSSAADKPSAGPGSSQVPFPPRQDGPKLAVPVEAEPLQEPPDPLHPRPSSRSLPASSRSSSARVRFRNIRGLFRDVDKSTMHAIIFNLFQLLLA